MDFFQNLTNITTSHNEEWVIVVKQVGQDKIVLSVLYKNLDCNDPASKIIPPMTFNNSTEKIDECFFADMNEAIPDTARMLSSMEHFLKQKEKAKVASAMEKDKQVKAEKDKTDKQRKYEEGMKKADELEEEGKFRDAWMKVPSIEYYPEHEQEIRTRKTELSLQFAPDLFNNKP
jgi:hypothetical protein